MVLASLEGELIVALGVKLVIEREAEQQDHRRQGYEKHDERRAPVSTEDGGVLAQQQHELAMARGGLGVSGLR